MSNKTKKKSKTKKKKYKKTKNKKPKKKIDKVLEILLQNNPKFDAVVRMLFKRVDKDGNI